VKRAVIGTTLPEIDATPRGCSLDAEVLRA
jgi:hypothetical protein